MGGVGYACCAPTPLPPTVATPRSRDLQHGCVRDTYLFRMQNCANLCAPPLPPRFLNRCSALCNRSTPVATSMPCWCNLQVASPSSRCGAAVPGPGPRNAKGRGGVVHGHHHHPWPHRNCVTMWHPLGVRKVTAWQSCTVLEPAQTPAGHGGSTVAVLAVLVCGRPKLH